MAYVYRFLNEKDNTIYIGKTCRKVETRIEEHFSDKGHLDKQCYKDTYKIEYLKFKTDADSLLVETYLINKYRPMYNKANKSKYEGQTIKLDIKEDWKLYKQLKLPSRERQVINKFKNMICNLGISLILFFIILTLLLSIL